MRTASCKDCRWWVLPPAMSAVPTEPGDYRWRAAASAEWAIRKVYIETGWHFKVPTLCVGVREEGGREAGVHPVAVDDARLGGEWGERIPGNEALAALAAVPTSSFDWKLIAAVLASRGNPGAANRFLDLDAALREHAPWLVPPKWVPDSGEARRRCRRCGELVAPGDADGECPGHNGDARAQGAGE